MQHAELIQTLDNVFEGSPWYGEAVLPLLENVSEQEASAETGGRSVRRLVLHVLAWRRFVLEHLQDNATYDLHDHSDDWPERPDCTWNDVLELLRNSQRELLDALRAFPPERLQDRVPVRTYNYEFLVGGLIQHDVYHLGQIALLLALQKT